MRITWITRSFLDYRIPVYQALDNLCGNNLTVIYNKDVVPDRCQIKLRKVLKERAIGLSGEVRLSGVARDNATMANKGIRIPFQKGLVRAIRKSHPDIMISDGFYQWTYAPLIVRMFNTHNIKHIMCYERTPHTERNAGKLRTFYRKFVSKWIDAIDCNGSLTAEYVTKILGYKKPLAFGHMTAETEGVKYRVDNTTDKEVCNTKSKHKLQGLTFLYLGQIIPRKGIMELVKAWHEAKLQNATLLLVGDGSQRETIERYIKANNINNIQLAGAVNYDNLGPYYKAADCFIIPTLEDNWSLVVPEAMAAELPIACSIYNGCHPELVHKENGWLFNPLDINDTIKTLHLISSSQDNLKSMGKESRIIVASHTPQHAANGLYNICNQLIEKNRDGNKDYKELDVRIKL